MINRLMSLIIFSAMMCGCCSESTNIECSADDLLITNGRVVMGDSVVDGKSVLIKDGKIAEILDSKIVVKGATVLDAVGKYVSPGFIDIHCHGGGGDDFMDCDPEAVLRAVEFHTRYGTTSIVPTTIASSPELTDAMLETYAKAKQMGSKGANMLGLHIEGPYFSMGQRGAQDPRYIKNPDPQEYKTWLSKTNDIVRWSLAPELEGAMEMGRYLKSKGIIASIAHTEAVDTDVFAAVENGFSLVTHFYSCMNGVIRRNSYRFPGPIEAAYLIDSLDVEIIADGRHLPPTLLKLIYKIKGSDHVALVTDAMRAAGFADGQQSVLGSKEDGRTIIIEDGVAKMPDRTAFAGSVATTDRLVRTMIQMAEVSVPEAVKMASTTPARIMGYEKSKGRIAQGMDADIVIFDDNVNVSSTIVGGKIVYNKKTE